MNLILIRHGEIDSNLRKVYSGRSAEPLNTTGHQQAEEAAERLAGREIDALYCSPLLRTRQTAEIIAKRVSCPLLPEERFTELGMGPWEGLSETEVESLFPVEFDLWNREPAALNLPGRETLAELQSRALSGLASIIARESSAKCLAVVSHVAVIRVLLLWADGRKLNDYKHVRVPNATPIERTLEALPDFPSPDF